MVLYLSFLVFKMSMKKIPDGHYVLLCLAKAVDLGLLFTPNPLFSSLLFTFLTGAHGKANMEVSSQETVKSRRKGV